MPEVESLSRNPHIESPGAKDVYHFQATPGQLVYFDIQLQIGLGLLDWALVDSLGAQIFRTCLGCGDPGAFTLSAGGVYTLTVGETRNNQVGTYQFKLWDGLPPAPPVSIERMDFSDQKAVMEVYFSTERFPWQRRSAPLPPL
jgi:hypothetical protein